VQSEPVRQDRPFPHVGQAPPPQSTSVSAPFRKPSEQLGAALGAVQTKLGSQ
jgi:hypothetical protein